MKIRVYMRIGDARGTSARDDFKVAASTTADARPLAVGENAVIPTAMFAMDLDMDPDAFKLAEHVLVELGVGLHEVRVAAEVGEIEQ